MITDTVKFAFKRALSWLRREGSAEAARVVRLTEPDEAQAGIASFNAYPAELAPVHFRSQPWRMAKTYRYSSTLLRLPAPPPKPYILPKVYGRPSLPLADEVLPNLHTPPALNVSLAHNIILLPKNVVLNAETCEILNYTFLRGPYQVHGGLSRVSKANDFQLRYSLSSPDVQQLNKPVFFADTDRPGVYGHVLLEAITRLWALRQCGLDASVATSVRMNKNYARLFSYLGANLEDMIVIDRPLQARQVIFPDLPMRRRTWIHPQTWTVFNTLKRLAHFSTVDTPERIYISRSRVKGRKLLNEAAVEELFKAKGFTIVHPQDLPIEDQIKIFTNARLIASVGGSAAHNALFAPDNAKVLVLSSDGWLVNADMLLSQVEGRLAYVFGEPVERPTDTHRTQSAWTIDIKQVATAIKGHFDL